MFKKAQKARLCIEWKAFSSLKTL